MPDILSLPNELLFLIASELGIDDLVSLARTCRILNSAAVPRLYKLGIKVGTGRKPSMTLVHWLASCYMREDVVCKKAEAIVREARRRAILRALAAGANIEAKDKINRTPLVHALQRAKWGGQWQLLLEKGAEVDTPFSTGGMTPLFVAAQVNAAKAVVALLDRGANIEEVAKSACWSIEECVPRTPLLEAVSKCHYETAETLLDRGADIGVFGRAETADSAVKVGTSVLHAVGSGVGWYTSLRKETHKMVELLLDRGADPNAKNENGETPLYAYVESKSFGIPTLRLMIARGADPFITTNDGANLIHVVRDLAKARFLLELGLEANTQRDNGKNPLWTAIGGRHTTLAKLLIKHGARVDVFETEGETPLHAAVGTENLELVKAVYNAGPKLLPIECEDGVGVRTVPFIDCPRRNNGFTALHCCVALGNIKIASYLFSRGANVNARDERGVPVVAYAAAGPNHSPELLRLCLKKGASAKDHSTGPIEGFYNASLLFLAASNLLYEPIQEQFPYDPSGCEEECEVLIEQGADVRETFKSITNTNSGIRARTEVTAMHFACTARTVDILQRHGADVNARDSDGDTPLLVTAGNIDIRSREQAARKTSVSVCRALIRHGANANVHPYNRPNATALVESMVALEPELLKLLVDNGADVKQTFGTTPQSQCSTLCALLRFHDDRTFDDLEGPMETLLNAGADINHVSGSGITVLWDVVNAIHCVDRLKKLRFLVKRGAETGKLYRGYSILHLIDDKAILNVLLRSGADVNMKDEWGHTALHNVAFSRNIQEAVEWVDFWCSHGADVNMPNGNGRNILFSRFSDDSPDVVKALLRFGANPNCRFTGSTSYGGNMSILSRAVFCGINPAIIEALLKAGADPNVYAGPNDYKTTLVFCPLLRTKICHTAAEVRDNDRRLELLLQYGADVNVHHSGFLGTPLHIAVSVDVHRLRPEHVRMLLDAGADPFEVCMFRMNKGYSEEYLTPLDLLMLWKDVRPGFRVYEVVEKMLVEAMEARTAYDREMCEAVGQYY